MSRQITIFTEKHEAAKAFQKGLNGQWVPLLDSLLDGGETVTHDDLPGIVDEYKNRAAGAESPVWLGTSSNANSEPLGKISALKQMGSTLYGKFSGVDPRVEHLYSRGAFPKKSVVVKKSLDGTSLKGVGLIHPTYVQGALTDERTPSLDELMQKYTGEKDLRFGEQPMKGHDYRGFVSVETDIGAPEIRKQVAQNAVSALKGRGLWSNWCERFGLPALFAEMAGTRGFRPFVEAVSAIMEGYTAHEPTGAFFSECVKYRAREKGITFNEALSEMTRKSTGDPLTDAAYARAREKNITFGEALSQVVEENPELAVGGGRRA